MTARIDRRDDVNPERGEKQYGDVSWRSSDVEQLQEIVCSLVRRLYHVGET